MFFQSEEGAPWSMFYITDPEVLLP
jgi:hypothetical protein